MRSAMMRYAKERISRTADRVAEVFVDRMDEIMYRAERRIRRTEEAIGGILAFYLLGVLSVIFLSLALFYGFREFLSFSRALSFLIVGVVVLIIGLILRIKFREDKNGKRQYETDEKFR